HGFSRGYLLEAIEDIFLSKNESIIGLSEQKNITLSEIIKYRSHENIISYFKDKVLKAFSRASTEDQFKKYFGPLGFDVSKFFNMAIFNDEVQQKLTGWDLDKLIAIFNERHDIVHNGKKPLNSLEDLLIRREFFEKIVLNIAIELNLKFGILNNFNLPESLIRK
ncbi:MAG: hypothetical protein NTV82_00305, partial [Candidatus Aminicenantes bacterium]|nr:hypothetical protein [Candidatus Aminicenantes bacterium]